VGRGNTNLACSCKQITKPLDILTRTMHSIGDVLQKMDQVQQYKFGYRTMGRIKIYTKQQSDILSREDHTRMEASTNMKPSMKCKREGKETVVKVPRSTPALDDTLDMDELFESVIGAAPAANKPVTKFTLGSLADRVLEVRDGIIQPYSLSKPFQTFSFTTNR